MKDYKLSEIKKICKAHYTGHYTQCEICPLRTGICSYLNVAPAYFNIDEEDGEEDGEPKVKRAHTYEEIALFVKKQIASDTVYDEYDKAKLALSKDYIAKALKLIEELEQNKGR